MRSVVAHEVVVVLGRQGLTLAHAEAGAHAEGHEQTALGDPQFAEQLPVGFPAVAQVVVLAGVGRAGSAAGVELVEAGQDDGSHVHEACDLEAVERGVKDV